MTTADVGALSPRVTDIPILLVEDDTGDAVLVQACLDEAGVRQDAITWVRTLAEAQMALKGGPACVLLDLGLPDAVGFGAVEALVHGAPDTAIIVLTGRAGSDGISALSAGAQDYLVKDAITAPLLERSIRYAVERKRAQADQLKLHEFSLTAGEQARLERGLLPVPLLLTDTVSCDTYYKPGNNAVLGGDFYDVVEGSDGRVRAVIGDVMGHGPDEAAIGVHLRVAWRTLVLAGMPDDQVLPMLAALLAAESDRSTRFVTVCTTVVDGDAMTVRTAGHPAPIVHTANRGTVYLELDVGEPLGLSRDPDPTYWPATTVAVEPGTSVVLYSDGLLDGHRDADPDNVGVSGLVTALDHKLTSGVAPAQWLPELVGSGPAESVDDQAVVVLTVGPSR